VGTYTQSASSLALILAFMQAYSEIGILEFSYFIAEHKSLRQPMQPLNPRC